MPTICQSGCYAFITLVNLSANIQGTRKQHKVTKTLFVAFSCCFYKDIYSSIICEEARGIVTVVNKH